MPAVRTRIQADVERYAGIGFSAVTRLTEKSRDIVSERDPSEVVVLHHRWPSTRCRRVARALPQRPWVAYCFHRCEVDLHVTTAELTAVVPLTSPMCPIPAREADFTATHRQ